MGRAGGPPQVPLNLVGDFGGGSLYLLLGVLSALWEAGRSGRGQVVDAAIVDGAASLMAMPFAFLGAGLWQDRRGSNLLDTGAPFYDVYETSDGGWMAVGPLEPQFYAAFVHAARHRRGPGAAGPVRPPRRGPTLRRRFAEVFAQPDPGTSGPRCSTPQRRLRGAGAVAGRGSGSTRTSRPAAPTSTRDGRIEPAPAPRFDRTPAELGDGPPRPGRAQPGDRSTSSDSTPTGCSRTGSSASEPAPA